MVDRQNDVQRFHLQVDDDRLPFANGPDKGERFEVHHKGRDAGCLQAPHLGVHQFSGVVEEGVEAILGIKKTLESLKPGDAGGVKPEPEEILGLFLEIMNARLEGEGSR